LGQNLGLGDCSMNLIKWLSISEVHLPWGKKGVNIKNRVAGNIFSDTQWPQHIHEFHNSRFNWTQIETIWKKNPSVLNTQTFCHLSLDKAVLQLFTWHLYFIRFYK
jgi:hypothetical protein